MGYFRQADLHPNIDHELHSEGNMYENLLTQSDTGAHRGDAWAYDLDGQVDFETAENDFPVGNFSDDEAGNEVGSVFDWNFNRASVDSFLDLYNQYQ